MYVSNALSMAQMACTVSAMSDAKKARQTQTQKQQQNQAKPRVAISEQPAAPFSNFGRAIVKQLRMCYSPRKA